MKRASESRLVDLTENTDENESEAETTSSGNSTVTKTSNWFDDNDSFDSDSSSSDSSASSMSTSMAPSNRSNATNGTATNFINPDTMAAAAAIMARDQSNRRRPILLGSNTDGTINVQLPTGMVIAVEATAFPDYNRAAAASSKANGGNNPMAAAAAAAAVCGAPVVPRVPIQPPVQERATSKATIAEIERALPSAASCVFHIFDRRVNLDAHSGRPSDTYSLLRAWAQDDPYRYNDIVADYPPTSLSSKVSPFVRVREETEPVTLAAKSAPSIADCATDNAAETIDHVQQIKLSSPASAPSIEELRGLLIQKARAVKKQKTSSFHRRDAQVIQRLRERDIELATN